MYLDEAAEGTDFHPLPSSETNTCPPSVVPKAAVSEPSPQPPARRAARTCTRCSGWRWRGTRRSRSCPPPAWHQLCEWSSEKQPRSELHLRNTAGGTEVTVTASSQLPWACIPGASSPQELLRTGVHTWGSTNAQGLQAILTVLHTYWGGGKNEMI